MAETKALSDLKIFLNKLFQFESQGLDFGIYKILHYKRKEVKEFIDKLLIEKVKEQLQVFDAEQQQQIESELRELDANENIQNYNKALTTDQAEADVLYKYNKKNIDRYLELKKQLGEVHKTGNTEETIYNHLTLFFSRYYDKGDFISKRRFGKNEKYIVPYNGEETHFYWANQDQYYIKSSEYFQQFAFKILQLKGTLTINFKLTDAQTEQGNVKAEENKYFVLSEKPAELTDFELTIFFEFRSLTEEEKKTYTVNGKQDLLNEKAVATLKEQWGKKDATAELWKEDDKQQTLLLRKLHQYTRKNSYDFFIHKDLKGFLQRELDFYIKSELVKVKDLYVLDSEQHFDNIRHNFKLIKCFKNIADIIIDFLSQIEDFQKKLWEKKKFVLSTEWVITIDKLAAWLDKEPFEALAKQVLDNKAQIEEWKQLFGWDELPFELALEGLKADLNAWYKLPVDTKHFDASFKGALLNELSGKINLESESNGLVIHSDNYQGLILLHEKFREQVKCIYIDPPYNTVEAGFLYKNNFKHSSWNTMINSVVGASQEYLTDDGVFYCAIDDYELKNLDSVLSNIFGELNFLGRLIVEIKPSGRTNDFYLSTSHEYYLCFAKNPEKASIVFFPLTKEEIEKYKEGEGENAYKWRDFLRTGGFSTPQERPNSYYPIYYEPKSNKVQLENFEGGIEILPIDSEGNKRVWRKTPKSFLYHLNKGEINFTLNKHGNWKVQIIDKLKIGTRPKSVWVKNLYDASSHGTKLLKKLFKEKTFSFPKSIHATKDVIFTVAGNDDESFILDYFGGSGTTFHATQLLNQEDEGQRKCILIEQGIYIYSVIIPRVKKIAYSFDWKDGEPQNMSGLGVFIKYQKLEQYEESLENIAFTANEKTVQQAMAFDNYIPKYFLELETRGSKTFVNIEAMQNPWAYTLKLWDGFTYDTEQAVDLVETFNYLIGLHLQKQFTWEENRKKYMFVWGWNKEQKKALVIWRDTTGWKEKDYEYDRTYIESKLNQFEYDALYINGQSTLPGYQMIEEIFKTKMIPD